MEYYLVALIVATGEVYVEREGLTLHQCAGHAAMIRQETQILHEYIGEVRYMCLERDICAETEPE